MAREVSIGGAGSLFVGEDKVLRLICVDASSVPVNVATWTMGFYVGLNDRSTTFLFSATPLSVTGAYNVDPTLNTQRTLVPFTDDELNAFRAKTYRYGWKRLDAGSETMLMYGDFAPEKAPPL